MNAAGSSSALSTAAAYALGRSPVTIDELVNAITASQNVAEHSVLLKDFTTKDAREPALTSNLSNGQDPLEVLDAERHTLPYLYILSARLQLPASQRPSLEIIEGFCSRFDPAQARLAPDRVTSLAKQISTGVQGNVKAVLGALSNLITRYPPSLSYLTTLHPIFLTACVATKHYTTALPVLTVPITFVDLKVSGLTYNDNLVYHYAGGVAFGALKRWREAEEFFEICASSPAQVPAAVQLEASKKLVLVQLILYGKTIPPPKYTNPTLQRLLKNSPYGQFLKIYPQQRQILYAAIQKDTELFQKEKNTGLIHQTIERAPRWLIKKLTATYLTLGLSDIAREVGVDSEDEVRAIVVSMIESDEISASISADGTVTFSDPVPQFSKRDIDALLKQAQEQTRILYDMERAMNANKDYLTKAVKHKDEASSWPDEDVVHSGGATGWVDDAPYS
ncbi:hypothetical protein WOLCODRAFT_139360 [Wolfiporia cocos MD-104 SS10]|uniref:COP9 signalosome complex subunit 3 n=1 Tax=Wolfiporia cocos (strain MD-104) TaxID=742152 RepID=A0A2H3JS69_WOLCO|nr:hypothetical protein WOLCODRAFT_139360 [Wolfiporia cocos MD-104 SS10]